MKIKTKVATTINEYLNKSINKAVLTPVIPNKYVYHSSIPSCRDNISKEGLVPNRGDQWLSDTPIDGKAIFATNSDNPKDWFDSGYNDDIYKINTSNLPNKWYEDPNFENHRHIFTFENIPLQSIELIHKSTGVEHHLEMSKTKVYRGVGSRINATYGKGPSDDGMGVFWVDNLTMAKWFAGLIEYSIDTDRYEKIKNAKGTILKKDIQFTNPYIINSRDENWDSFQVYMKEIKKYSSANNYKKMLKQNNHDGIILKNNNTNYYEDGEYTIYIEL